MLVGGLLIFWFGFEFGFGVDAATFIISALLIAIVRFPGGSERKEKERAEIFLGIRRMFSVPGLRRSLMISLQVSVVGGLAIVTTAGYVKNELKMEEAFTQSLWRSWASVRWLLRFISAAAKNLAGEFWD